MKKDNRTAQASNTATVEPQNSTVLESKYGRGKNPASRRKKPERKLVKITRNVYEDQARITGKQLRDLITKSNALPL